jgi:hypothetical protein
VTNDTVKELPFSFRQHEQVVWEAYSDSYTDEESPYPKLTMEDLKRRLTHYYEASTIHKYSSALDILASFIKAQAFLYNESSNQCRQQLNYLMMPCICLSTLCSVFANFSTRYQNGALIIAGINAIISFLLAIVNYFKLDAAAEAHHISSTHYYRLKTQLEFSSGETLLFEHPLLQAGGVEAELEVWSRTHQGDEDFVTKRQTLHQDLTQKKAMLREELINNLQEKIGVIRQKVLEIRENNRFAIPSTIMNHYPIIYNINIFSFIKTVDDYKMSLLAKLKNVLNEIRFWGHRQQKNGGLVELEGDRVKQLYVEKKEIMTELFVLISTYNLIDLMFQQEIQNAYLARKHWFRFWAHALSGHNAWLPDGYKDPYDCGYCDPTSQKTLLRKILNV